MLQIKQIRQEKGYTQDYVAKQLRISRAAYTNIENSKRDPDTATLLALADLFNTSVDALFGRVSIASPSVSDGEPLLKLYNSVNANGKKAIYEYAVFISEKDEYKKVSEKSAM